jgi:hypothetical protein
VVRSGLRGGHVSGRLRLKCDGTCAETTFRLSAKRTSPFKPAGASFQSTTGSRGVRISGFNAGYTMFRGSVKSTGYPFHSSFSPSLPLPCVTVCHHISAGLYQNCRRTTGSSPACVMFLQNVANGKSEGWVYSIVLQPHFFCGSPLSELRSGPRLLHCRIRRRVHGDI